MKMNGKVKVVMTGINFVCLIITLLYPNNATPFAVVPVIATTTAWVLIDKEGHAFSRFLVLATCVASICLLIGLTGTLEKKSPSSIYYRVLFNENVAFIGDTSFDYGVFVALILGFFSFSAFMDWHVLPAPPAEELDINRTIKSKIK